MGKPPRFRNDSREPAWLAKARAAVLRPFRHRLLSRADSLGHRIRQQSNPSRRWPYSHRGPGRYFVPALLVAAATAVCLLLQPVLLVGSLVLPYLIAILLAAIGYGLLPSLFASVLSVAAFDYFFLQPYYDFYISDPDDVARLAVFALAAVIVSNLAAYARRQAVTAGFRAEVAEDLYRFGHQLAGAATSRAVVDAALPRLMAMLRARVQIVLPAGGDCPVDRADQPGNARPKAVIAGAEYARIKSWLLDVADTPPPVSARWLFVPIRTGRAKLGILAIAREDLDRFQMPTSDPLFGTLADLLAQAIDRINLVDDLDQASRAAEREQLHAALLASLSHDLRSPLAAVLSSVENLILQGDMLCAERRQDLIRLIQDDARRLDRYFASLLDMTRLETGLATSTESRIDLTDAVSAALDRCAGALSGHRVSVALESDLPLLGGDEVLLEHVLFNLLDNAAKYTQPGSLIELRAFRDQGQVVVEIMDEGEGIRPGDLERIFQKFYRARREGPQPGGIGLGLAICRGYLEAMHGHIVARNRTDRGGAVFSITMPAPAVKESLERTA
jgi:two-component system, OmpR family, sensor histidine kinase KdpD